MNENDFENSEMGRLLWESRGMYFHFEPNFLPPKFKPSETLSNQFIRTALALGRLDGLAGKLSPQEIHLLRTPFILKEAKFSSEIEGTRSTLTDVYKEEKQKETDMERALDNEEIRNYIKALSYGLERINGEIPEDIIKEMHTILLQGVRGHNKDPGMYKTTQNAIGKRYDTMDTAKFVPASPETTPDLMKNLMDYINGDDDSNVLLKISLAHYQFEAIHPFRDGNGRLGRLLIMLLMIKEKIINHPLLYISEYFNRNRSTYTDLLYDVSSKNRLDDWILFFLKGLESQANSSLKLINDLDSYKTSLQDKISKYSQSLNIHRVIEMLFKNPFITIKDVKYELGVSYPGASNIIHKLEELKILEEITGKRYRKLYLASSIIDILEDREDY